MTVRMAFVEHPWISVTGDVATSADLSDKGVVQDLTYKLSTSSTCLFDQPEMRCK